MENTKLIQVLQSLSPLEMKRFDKFVHSPYFNSHEDTIALFEVLKAYYPDFDHPGLDHQEIFTQLYPAKRFQANQIYTLNKYLLNLLLDFLAQEEIENESFLSRDLALKRALYKKQLHKFLPRLIEKSEEKLESHPYRNANFFRESYRLEELKTEYVVNLKNRSVETSYKTAMEQLDAYYLVQKLSYVFALLNRQRVLANEEDIQLLEEIVSFCEKKDLSDWPVVEIYFQTVMMLKSPNGSNYFNKLRKNLPQKSHWFEKEELTALYTSLINFCTQRYKRGNMAFLRYMFDLYKEMLELDILFTVPHVASLFYKNVVTLGLKLKEGEWTEQFIKTYKDRIDPQYRKGVFNYNMANLHFFKGEYSKCLKFLQRVEIIDPFIKLNYDMLLMKTYYECGEIEALYSLCASFSAYIRRNNALSANNKQAYLNMAKYMRRLAKVKFVNKHRLPALRESFYEVSLLVERDWIAEKIEELSKNLRRRYRPD